MPDLPLDRQLQAGQVFKLSLEADVADDGTVTLVGVRTWDQELTPSGEAYFTPGENGYRLRELEAAARTWLLLISGNAVDVREDLDNL